MPSSRSLFRLAEGRGAAVATNNAAGARGTSDKAGGDDLSQGSCWRGPVTTTRSPSGFYRIRPRRRGCNAGLISAARRGAIDAATRARSRRGWVGAAIAATSTPPGCASRVWMDRFEAPPAVQEFWMRRLPEAGDWKQALLKEGKSFTGTAI